MYPIEKYASEKRPLQLVLERAGKKLPASSGYRQCDRPFFAGAEFQINECCVRHGRHESEDPEGEEEADDPTGDVVGSPTRDKRIDLWFNFESMLFGFYLAAKVANIDFARFFMGIPSLVSPAHLICAKLRKNWAINRPERAAFFRTTFASEIFANEY
jgi:hypothetical protein